MKEVQFKFDVDDEVRVKKLNMSGVVKMCAFDRGGICYYITTVQDSSWWHQSQLEVKV